MALPNSPSGIIDSHWQKKKKKQPMEVTKKWLSSVLFSGLSSINQMVKTLQKKKKSVAYIKWNDHFNFLLKTNEQSRQQYCITIIKFAKTIT